MKWSEIDLAKATMITARNKTGRIRIAALWPRTIEALKAWGSKSDSVFTTEVGTKADYLCVYRLFKTLRKEAKREAVLLGELHLQELALKALSAGAGGVCCAGIDGPRPRG